MKDRREGASRSAPSVSCVSSKTVGEQVRQEGGQGYREGGCDVGEDRASEGLACIARLPAVAQCGVAGDYPQYGDKRGKNEAEGKIMIYANMFAIAPRLRRLNVSDAVAKGFLGTAGWGPPRTGV